MPTSLHWWDLSCHVHLSSLVRPVLSCPPILLGDTFPAMPTSLQWWDLSSDAHISFIGEACPVMPTSLHWWNLSSDAHLSSLMRPALWCPPLIQWWDLSCPLLSDLNYFVKCLCQFEEVCTFAFCTLHQTAYAIQEAAKVCSWLRTSKLKIISCKKCVTDEIQ